MIYWLRETPTRRGIKLRVGGLRGYLVPPLAKLWFVGLTLLTAVLGLVLAIVLLGSDEAVLPHFDRLGIARWAYYLLPLLPPFLVPLAFVGTPLGQVLGEMLLGSRLSINMTRDYVQPVRWLVYRPRHPIGPDTTFERVAHPKAAEEVRENALRRAMNPKNPGKAMQWNYYQQSQLVIMRTGPKVVVLARIWDRHPPGLNHKADKLLNALQRIHSELRTGNRSDDETKTPLQYGPRPSFT
jgi:hypothetical protein